MKLPPHQSSMAPEACDEVQDFREALLSQIKGSGMLDKTRSSLRKQLLGRLHQEAGRTLGGPKPSSMQEQVMNTVFAEYLGACQRTNTLSVFLAEVSLCESVNLTHDDILASLRIQPSSQLHKRITSALSEDKENGKIPRCFAQALLQSLSAVSSCTTAEAGTHTDEDPAGHAATQLALLDHRYESHGAARSAPRILAQKLADLQSQCDQRVALQVTAQVDVIREIELGQAREEEAARWRHEMSKQREELERLYTERMKHVRELEDAAVSRAQELQHAAERASFDLRQRMVAEDDRMRTALQERDRDICTREAALEAREASLTVREKQCVENQADCRRCCAEAAAQMETAKDEARQQAHAEVEKQRAALRLQRVAFEEERTRILALHDESSNAAAQLVEKNARIEALLVSKADADARANATSSELHLLQSHSRLMQHELELLHQELFCSTPGFMLDKVPKASLGSKPQVAGGAEGLALIRDEVQRLVHSSRLAESRTGELQERLQCSQRELLSAKGAAAAAKAEVDGLRETMHSAQALLRDAEASLEKVHSQADDYRLALKHANTELRVLEDSLAATKAARDDAIATASVFTMRASPCADAQHARQTASYSYMQACPSAECEPAAPESCYGGPCERSMGSSVALISQRLELLEMEEAELQEDYVAFRNRMAQQQAALHQCLAAGGNSSAQGHLVAPILPYKTTTGALCDFTVQKSTHSLHRGAGSILGQQSNSDTACAHSCADLEAIPAVHAVPGHCRKVDAPEVWLQHQTSGDIKEPVCSGTQEDCNTTTHARALEPAGGQVAQHATCVVEPVINLQVETGDQVCTAWNSPQDSPCAAEDIPSAADCGSQLVEQDQNQENHISGADSFTGSTGSAPDRASVKETVVDVEVADAVNAQNDSQDGEPEAHAESDRKHEATDQLDSGEMQHEVPSEVRTETSTSQASFVEGDEHAKELLDSERHDDAQSLTGARDIFEQQSQESIKLQVVGEEGSDNPCSAGQTAHTSREASSYSCEEYDDDVELDGIDFGMELPEEA